MSTSDHEAKGLAPDAAMKKQKGSSYAMIFVFFIIGFVVFNAGGWIAYPKIFYTEQRQPIDFNHKIHMGVVDKGCESCHYLREDGTFSGVPTNAQCVGCHQSVQGTSKDEAVFVNEYVAKNKEVPWLIYSRQPDCVFFSHAAHINKPSIESCEVCHGDIGNSESLKVYKKNNLSKYSQDVEGSNLAGFRSYSWNGRKFSDGMKMNDCGYCHKGGCFQCHK